MNLKTIKEYYPLETTILGNINIQEIKDTPAADINWEDVQNIYKNKQLNPEDNFGDFCFYNQQNKTFYRFAFWWDPLLGYVTYDDADDFYLLVREYTDGTPHVINPFENYDDEYPIIFNRNDGEYELARKYFTEEEFNNIVLFFTWEELATFKASLN